MKKALIIIGIVLVVVLGATTAGGYYVWQKAKQAMNDPETMKKMAEKAGSMMSSEAGSSIGDFLSKNVAVSCSGTNDQQTVNGYIKAGQVRFSITTASKSAEPSEFLVKDKNVFAWNPSTKEGFQLAMTDNSWLPTSNSTQNASGGNLQPATNNAPDGAFNPAAILSSLQKNNVSCKPTAVSDDVFAKPSDIKFTNMDEIMKMQAEMMGNPNMRMPEGMMDKMNR